MKIASQQNNQLYQLYRKDQLNRLNRKIEEIKNRKPKKQKEISLPKISYIRSLPPLRMEQILVENKRLNNKITETITTKRHSELKLLSVSEVNRAYLFTDLKQKPSTFRDKGQHSRLIPHKRIADKEEICMKSKISQLMALTEAQGSIHNQKSPSF